MSAADALQVVADFTAAIEQGQVTRRGKRRRGVLLADWLVLQRLGEIRDALTADPDWSEVQEGNLRAQLAEARAEAAGERAASEFMALLYDAAIRHVEGERDRARALVVRLEQEVALAETGIQRRVL